MTTHIRAREFAVELQAERLRRGKTQSELAALLGVHQSVISKWERGENVALSDAFRWADVLGVAIRFGSEVTA